MRRANFGIQEIGNDKSACGKVADGGRNHMGRVTGCSGSARTRSIISLRAFDVSVKSMAVVTQHPNRGSPILIFQHCPLFYCKVISPTPADRFVHLELNLINQESDLIWIATTNSLRSSSQNDKVFIRRPSEGTPVWANLQPGSKLRLTDAAITYGQQDEPPLVSITSYTEPLLIPKTGGG
jgi:hypothetical protein